MMFGFPSVSAAQLDLPAASNASMEEGILFQDIPSVDSVSKYEQKVMEAPSPVTIITNDEIKKYGYRTLAAILQSVNGLYVTNDRNYSYLSFRSFNRPGDALAYFTRSSVTQPPTMALSGMRTTSSIRIYSVKCPFTTYYCKPCIITGEKAYPPRHSTPSSTRRAHGPSMNMASSISTMSTSSGTNSKRSDGSTMIGTTIAAIISTTTRRPMRRCSSSIKTMFSPNGGAGNSSSCNDSGRSIASL